MARTETVTTYYDDQGRVIRREVAGGGITLVIFALLMVVYFFFEKMAQAWSTAPLWVHWAFWGLLGTAYLWGFVRHGGVRLLTYVALGLAALGIAAFGGLLVYAWLMHHPVHPDWQGFWMAVQTKILMRVF